MRKILKSVFTLTVVASFAIGLSLAYFSDTEISSGNTFTAGAIDLTVDSQAHYNGLTCIDGVWTNSCYPVGSELLVNGGFETPEVTDTAKWQIFSSIPGWTISWESTQTEYNGYERPEEALLEYHRNVLGSAYAGEQYVELDTDWQGPSGSLNGEPALVRIYQDIVTTPGTKYELRYQYSPRPNSTLAENELLVRIDGTQVASHSRNGGGTTDWSQHTYEFVATGNLTRVEFAGGGNANSLGVFLDDISLRETDCASRFSEYEGRACASSWELTDLGPTHQFFNFDDIKPGDQGENTISLHVESNPAYACVNFTNLEDNDLGLTEPESQVDSTDGPNNGELAKHIDVFMWFDNNGNNIWDIGELALDTFPNKAEVAWDTTSYGLALPSTQPLLPGETSYVGIYWCAGSIVIDGYDLSCDASSMGNEAQTDELLVDVSFYVEQTRNNEQFECQPVDR